MLLATLLLLCTFGYSLRAQDSLHFQPLFQQQPLELDKVYSLGTAQKSTSISQLKFYIGYLECWQDQQLVHTIHPTYHLLDASNPSSLSLNLPDSLTFNQLRFWVGVDSATNAQGVQGGALDPMQGMYWTWQSGYINFKLEGKSAYCSSRGQEFQFHVGGFQQGYCPVQQVILEVTAGEDIRIGLEVDQLLLLANLEENDHLMSPSQQAMDFAQFFPLVFRIL